MPSFSLSKHGGWWIGSNRIGSNLCNQNSMDSVWSCQLCSRHLSMQLQRWFKETSQCCFRRSPCRRSSCCSCCCCLCVFWACHCRAHRHCEEGGKQCRGISRRAQQCAMGETVGSECRQTNIIGLDEEGGLAAIIDLCLMHTYILGMKLAVVNTPSRSNIPNSSYKKTLGNNWQPTRPTQSRSEASKPPEGSSLLR